MLNERGVEYRYREYTKEPLTEGELRGVLARLGLAPRDVLRRHDRAFEELGLTGDGGDNALVAHMAEHPTLLQRPIGVLGERAVVGRPADRLLGLIDS
ncbi:MAG: arsenate reductase (glutaredoxin) [bacterium]|nr:arsenate reductase (glutaredoxin) [bacterium]